MLTTNLLEPWVLFRLAAGLVATALFVRGAFTAQKVLRRFDAKRATEGQLALEKQLELAATFARVAAVVQVSALVLAVLGADRLSRGVRGAMCAYGVFGANEWGFRSLFATTAIAVVAGVVAEVFAFDTRVRTLDLARPLAWVLIAMAGFAAIDFVLATRFLLGLDLTVVSSCCSVQLDPVASSGAAYAGGPRVLATALGAGGVLASIAAAAFAARWPSRRNVIIAGAATILTMPAAVLATVLEVAPHAFEAPQHVCPFCLLKADVLGVGYPLFGAIYFATISVVAAAVGGVLSTDARALAPFAKSRMRRGAIAWAFAAAVAAIPIARYMIVSDGASLFAAGSP